MKKVLVTGGLGFIGSHTVVELTHAGFQPIIADNLSNSQSFILERIEKITGCSIDFYQIDCTDYTALKKIFKEHLLEGAIHFAAYKAVGESVEQPIKYYKNNLGSLWTLLECMHEFGVSNLVFSSSCTVYGNPLSLPVSEQAPILPAASPYGNTKQICEEIIADAIKTSRPLKSFILRYFNPIGAHPSGLIGELPLGVPNNLVPFITQTAAGLRKELKIFGRDYPTPDGTCIRDYIHVIDLAQAHVKALEVLEDRPEATFLDYVNIGTGQGHSVYEMVQMFEKVSGQALNYIWADRREGDVPSVYAGTHKSYNVLGWKAQLSIEQALQDAWQWQKTFNNTH